MGRIYFIYNIISKKGYVGQTIQPLYKRIYQHFYQAKKGVNTPLYYALRKYSRETFEIRLIEECEKFSLDEKEQYWINYYNTFNEGYNCDLGGGGIKGLRHSEETRKKMSDSKKGKPSGRKGKTNSEESNRKRSESLRKAYKNGIRKPRDYSDVSGKNSKNYKNGKYTGHYAKYRKNKE